MLKTVLGCWFCLAVATTARGQVSFTPPRLDLGHVKAGQVFDHTVQVRNACGGPLKVASIKASCGCLSPKLEPGVLEAGAAGILKLRINTLVSPSGPQGWRLAIHFEGGATAEYLITGEVVQEIVLSPNAVTIYGNRRTTQHTLTLQDRRSQPLTLLKAESTSPLIEVGPLPTLTGVPAQCGIKLTIREGFSEGRHEETVTLHTSDPEYPRLQVPISVVSRSVSRFVAMPSNLCLRSATDVQQVTVRDRQELLVKLDRWESSHPGLRVEVVRSEGGSVALRVGRLPGTQIPTDVSQTLEIYLVGIASPIVVPVEIR